MQRILGIDVGSKTIGVAVSDLLKITAQGKENYRYKEWDVESAKNKIISLVEEWNPEVLVVGQPKHMNGDISDTQRYIEEIIDGVQECIEIKVTWIDERWTSKQATRSLIAADFSRKKRKNKIDQTAAVIILQAYLDSL